jgi:hypothetical protein
MAQNFKKRNKKTPLAKIKEKNAAGRSNRLFINSIFLM